MGAETSTEDEPLPSLFALYALAALLRDFWVAAVLLSLHSALLAPRLAAHALRRALRGGDRSGSGSDDAATKQEAGCEFYEGVVTHTRLSPVHHAFKYPVRRAPRRAGMQVPTRRTLTCELHADAQPRVRCCALGTERAG
jgi:hypothetical protein